MLHNLLRPVFLKTDYTSREAGVQAWPCGSEANPHETVNLEESTGLRETKYHALGPWALSVEDGVDAMTLFGGLNNAYLWAPQRPLEKIELTRINLHYHPCELEAQRKDNLAGLKNKEDDLYWHHRSDVELISISAISATQGTGITPKPGCSI